MTLFELVATLSLDADAFINAIGEARDETEKFAKEASGSGESAWTTFNQAREAVSGIASSVVSAVKSFASMGLSLVEVSANAEAMQQTMAAAFEGVEDDAEAAFARIGELNNIDTWRLQESGIGFYRQFLSAGADSSEAMQAMEDALGYAADAAAAYNVSLEDAASMMRSFIRGNVEAGESIGLFVTQQAREAKAAEMYQSAWADLNEEQRQFVLLDITRQAYENGKVLGQGAREADNWSNVLGNLNAKWEKAQAIMGEKMRIALVPALEELGQWIEDNPEVWESLGELFGEIATHGVEALKSLLTFLNQHKDDIVGFLDSLTALMNLLSNPWGETQQKTSTGRDTVFDAFLRYAQDEISYRDFESIVGDKALASELNTLFNDYKDQYGDEAVPTAELVGKWTDDTMTKLQTSLDNANLTANVNAKMNFSDLASWAWNGISGWMFGDRPEEGQTAQYNAKGLGYVPYDNYLTRLHRGESVLNRVQAQEWRSGQLRSTTGQMDPAALGNAVKAALQGVSVQIDGHTAGTLLTPYVSKEQYKEAWKRR